jgi:hypothetical protein
MRGAVRGAAWIAFAAAACGDGETRSEPAIDAYVEHPADPPPRVEEAAECAGAPMIPRTGVALVASALRILEVSESIDLGGTAEPDNGLAVLIDDTDLAIAEGLQLGSLALPFELFDRGPDLGVADGCVKLALYRGACAGGPCNFTDGVPDAIRLVGDSIPGGVPVSRLRAMQSGPGGALALAGPGYLEVPLPMHPFSGGGPLISFTFPISVTHADGALTADGFAMLRVAGVIQAFRLGQLAVPLLPVLDTRKGDTALDATFANFLGSSLLFLTSNGRGCLFAEVDVDGDGVESFCDTLDDGLSRVDTCIDGNGTAVRDGDNGVADCSQALKQGRPRFVDGISAQLAISARPATFTP